MSNVVIAEESFSSLEEYCKVPISFQVESVLQVKPIEDGLGGFCLEEEPVEYPWMKDYDGYTAEGPKTWVDYWNLSNWGLLSARVDGKLIGGCVLAFNTPGMSFLEARKDLLALWDIRVAPQWRGKGVGRKLFVYAEDWGREHSCRWMKIETQNVNVPACRFYSSCDCQLRSIHRHRYPQLPSEVQLIWWKDLSIIKSNKGGGLEWKARNLF